MRCVQARRHGRRTREPIDDDRRATMIGWAAKGPLTEDEATKFVSDNIAAPLPELLPEVLRSRT